MGWKEKGNKLFKEFKYRTFRQALEFVNRTGAVCELNNSHPEIVINKTKVLITVNAHSSRKLSEEDYHLSKFIDKIK